MDHKESSNENGGVSRIESHDAREELIASTRENAPEQTLENPNEEKSPGTSSEEPPVSSVSVPSELESSHLAREEPCHLCNGLGVEKQEETVQNPCRFCRCKPTNNDRGTSISEIDKATAASVLTESDFLPDSRSAYGDCLLGLSDSTSLAEYNFSGSEQQVEDLKTEAPQKEKTPSSNCCHLFVQTSWIGLTIRMFLFERSFPGRREKHFTLYMIPAEDCKAYEEIHQQNIQRGNSRQIPFAVNNSQSEEFHTCFLENEDQITVSFEIENQHQQNFVAMDDDDRREFVFRGLTIRSESQNRLEKGAKSTFRVQCIGEPGALCQEQGVITLTINSHSSMITKLFFSISTWSSMRDHADEVQEGEI
ncbi:uncharacterized protein [Montipora capricornis]|uniref:uncharacterized protein n=1 Tax=Montipora capricornis TaxID=246305 RepID=UPI0035F1DCF2